MLNELHKLWNDENGFIVSLELILIATILVLGLIVGMSCLANAIVAEYQDLGWAVRSLNQSYFFGGFRGCKAWVPGSSYFNRPGMAMTDASWDLGMSPALMGTGYGTTGYAAPVYVAPAVVAPGPVLMPPTQVVPCPTGNCPPETSVPCETDDCRTGTILPGTPLTPTPDNNLPRLVPQPKLLKPVAPSPEPSPKS